MNLPINTPPTALARRETDTTMLVPSTIAGFYDFAADYWKSGLVPSSYKSMEQVAIAMIKGHEFGMLPAQSVDAFYVINGRACPWGRALRGLVQSSGTLEGELDNHIESFDEFSYLCGEENPFVEGTLDFILAAALQRELRRRMARIKGKNPGVNYLCGYSVVKKSGQAPKVYLFDSYDAHKAGLMTKQGPWSQGPGRMCMHRAATFIRSDVFSDRLTGLDMTAEEAIDVLSIDLGTQPAPAPRPETGTPSEVLRTLANRGPVEPPRERIVDMTPPPTTHRPEVETVAPPVAVPERAVVPDPVQPPPPPVEPPPGASVMHGLTGQTGTEILKAVCQRIKAAGDDATALMKSACWTVCGEMKTSKAMTIPERGLVAVELARLYDDEKARARDEADKDQPDDPTDAPAPWEPGAETTPSTSGVPPEIDF
jgi:hypothetical protein